MQKQKAEVGKTYRTPLLPTLRSIDEKARTIEFVASTENQDRYGDVIRVAGWKLDNYLKNPVFLWAHKSGEPPIGRTVALRTEMNPPALVQKVQFADAAASPFADTIFQLYKGGFLNAVSVGFMPLEMQPYTDLEGNNTGGVEFLEQELLELSAVPIPANADCLARAVQKGFSESDLERVFSGEEFSAKSPEQIYKELASINLEIATIAVELATNIVRDTLAKAKALGLTAKATPESGDVCTIEQLCNAVKEAGDEIRGSQESEL